MAILGAAYQIGRSALAAYQGAVTITGQNIANVGNPDYSRLSGRLSALYSGGTNGIQPGTGVDLTALERHLDEAVEMRLRAALGARNGAEVEYQTLSRVESLYNELTEYDLSSQLSQFFESLSNLQTDPVDGAARDLVVANAETVIRTLQRHRSGLLDQVSDLNAATAQMTQQANAYAAEIAQLNEKIVTVDARSPGGSAALRDRRDLLLRKLGELMDIQTREQANGVMNVYIGSEPLVDFARSRGLRTENVLENGFERVEVRFADNDGSVIMRTGRLAATVISRDEHIAGELTQVNRLASALIYEVNVAQTSGRGLVGYTHLLGTYAAADRNAALNTPAAGLDFPVQNGTFFVHVRDKTTGETVSHMIEVDLDGLNNNDTSLAALAAALSGVTNLSARVTGDNRLQLDTKNGYEVSFSEDTSGALAALGIGTFFTGTDAGDMGIHPDVAADGRLIATSLTGAAGDGANAARLAAVADKAADLLGGSSILDFQQSITTTLAVRAAAAETTHAATDAVYSSLLAQREAVSGVSLDEEAINLTKFERAFQGASRFITVLESLSDEVLALVQ